MKVRELTPKGPLAIKVTVLVPAEAYVCEKAVTVVLVVEPSPKSQKRLVIVPVEISEKPTTKGFGPLAGLPVKLACGSAAPTPVRALVLLPPSLRTMTTLLKLPAVVGPKTNARLVELKPGRSMGVAERIVNGPLSTKARMLVSSWAPRFVMTNEA